jgi:pyrroloquinoline quinone biosynthesis protein B
MQGRFERGIDRSRNRRKAIRLRLLGTAAGGGLPQWNCGCQNCSEARAGRIAARTQSSVAVSAGGEHWFLVNASPDLRAQIESFPALHARPDAARQSPIDGVLLTNADLDHVHGLMLLREAPRLAIHAPAAVRATLAKFLNLEAVLGAFCVLDWQEAEEEFAVLGSRTGPSGLLYRALPLPGLPPPFARGSFGGDATERGAHSVAFQIADAASGARLLIAPDVAAMTPQLEQAMRESDAVLLDGTFWDDEELRALVPTARTSREMGHLPISGADGTLALLRTMPAPQKIYLHINNTNPILRPESRERAEVEGAGVQVGEDGMEFVL